MLRDLLGIPWLAIKDKLPHDGEAYHYNKIGESLDVSHVQMARFMSAADYAMRQAMSAVLSGPNRPLAGCTPAMRFAGFWPREKGDSARSAVVPSARFARSTGRARRPCADFEPGNARARGRRQGFQHVQRCRRLQLEFSRTGRRPISLAFQRLHDLGRRRRNRPLVLRRLRRRKVAGLLAAAVASPGAGRSLARPHERADRRLRDKFRPEASARCVRFYTRANRQASWK